MSKIDSIKKFLFGQPLPYIELSDYEKLPKKDKLIWGVFYKQPNIIRFGEDFSSYLKKEFPIQYRLRSSYRRIKWFIKDKYSNLKYKVYNFFYPPHPILRKSIPKQWVDLVELIVDVNFAIILQFKTEMDSSSAVFDLKFSEWMGRSVEYIEKERIKKIEEIEKISESVDVGNSFMSNSPKNTQIFKKIKEIEEEIKQKDSEIIKQMVEYRDYFWT
ncbi:MAG: hypothetical protein EKK64_05490 [Neisseriaceae bacterium]|nr:MAG: hypothetical protein EKK64_05490 [Neisseriaceae bacterium]